MTQLNQTVIGIYTRFININQTLKINSDGNETYSAGRDKLSVRVDFKAGVSEIQIENNLFDSVIDSAQPTFYFNVESTRAGGSCSMVSTILLKAGNVFEDFAIDKSQPIVLGVASKFDVKLTGMKSSIRNEQFDVMNNLPSKVQNYKDSDQADLFNHIKDLLEEAQKGKEIISLRGVHI